MITGAKRGVGHWRVRYLKKILKNILFLYFIIYFLCLNLIFIHNYLYLIFKKWNELLNTKYKKYTVWCVIITAHRMWWKLPYNFFFKCLNFIRILSQKGRCFVAHRFSIKVMIGFLHGQMLTFVNKPTSWFKKKLLQ